MPAPVPRAYSGAEVLAVLENIAEAALEKPQKARALLQGVVEGILMDPRPDGYAVRSRVSVRRTAGVSTP